MERNNLLSFLILWMTISQGFAFSSDNRTAESSNFLVRKRRVIDRAPNANTRIQLQDVPYVVNIQKNGDHACAGSILAAQIILTTARCVQDNARYTVISGTISKIRGGICHTVNGILWHPRYVAGTFAHNIALLSIHPPINFDQSLNRLIPIFHTNSGRLPTDVLYVVSGYGVTYETRHGARGCIRAGEEEPRLVDPNELRSISLPLMNLQACRERHQNDPLLTNEVICTHHDERTCSPGENGNPLVHNRQLCGILVSDGFMRGSDIFVSVANPEHRNWILAHMNPANIPRYIPPPASPPRHNHRNPQSCSRVHPYDGED